jgi:tetratricopeptide (TPR) repeat protein
MRVGAEHLGYSPYIWLAMQRGRVLTYMGRCAEAAEALDRGLALAREHGEDEIRCWAHQGHVELAVVRADPVAALAHARMALETSQPTGTLLTLWSSWLVLGRAHALRGEWGEAIAALEEALDIIRERRTGLHSEPFMLAALAEALLGSGDLPRALTTAEEARRSAVRTGSRPAWIQARTILAATRRAAARMETGTEETELRSCLEMIEQIGQLSLEPAVRLELAALAGSRGDTAAQTRELTRAKELYAEMGAVARAEALTP